MLCNYVTENVFLPPKTIFRVLSYSVLTWRPSYERHKCRLGTFHGHPMGCFSRTFPTSSRLVETYFATHIGASPPASGRSQGSRSVWFCSQPCPSASFRTSENGYVIVRKGAAQVSRATVTRWAFFGNFGLY